MKNTVPCLEVGHVNYAVANDFVKVISKYTSYPAAGTDLASVILYSNTSYDERMDLYEYTLDLDSELNKAAYSVVGINKQYNINISTSSILFLIQMSADPEIGKYIETDLTYLETMYRLSNLSQLLAAILIKKVICYRVNYSDYLDYNEHEHNTK